MAAFSGQRRVRCLSGGRPLPGPAQFLLARLPGSPSPLPIFPASAGPGQWEFWLDDSHPLAAAAPGGELVAWGPIGRVLPWPERAARGLLVSSSLARLWPVMAWALVRGGPLTWIWPERPADELLQVLPAAVEVAVGAVTAELAEWADVAVIDVPQPAALAGHLRSLAPLRPADGVLAFQLPPMPCGFGGCQACWVETRRGRRLACVDGPALPV